MIAMEEGLIRFNKIYIIQSIPEGEMRTGEDILTAIKYTPNYEENSCNLIDVHSQMDLIHTLRMIRSKVQEGEYPFIHIESHGYSSGITLSSKERVPYQVLGIEIANINLATKNNLFISIAACRGAKFQFIMDIGKPCPFRGFIGPDSEPSAEKLRDAYVEFFKLLMHSNGFEEPISKVQEKFPELEMNTFSAEHFFDMLWNIQIGEKYNKGATYRKLLDKVAKGHWKRREVRNRYRSYSQFRKAQRKITRGWSVQDVKKELRNRFLHIQ